MRLLNGIFAICSFNSFVIMVPDTPYYFKNIFNASLQLPLLGIEYPSQNILLFPNTWQYLSLCNPSYLGFIVSDAISPKILFGDNIRSVLYLLDNDIIADLIWFWVILSKVNCACPTLIFQTSLMSLAIVLLCLLLDRNVLGESISSSAMRGV